MNFLSIFFNRKSGLLLVLLILTSLIGCDTEPEYVREKREANYIKVSAIALEDARVVTDPHSNKLIGCIITTEVEGKVWYIKLNPSWAWHLYAGCTPVKKGDPLDITKRVMERGKTDLLWKQIVELEDAL